MEYKGFISSLIERSESLLTLDSNDDLDVTRLLLVMNTGFALVRDRLRYWDNSDDKRLRAPGFWRKAKKAGKRKLNREILIENITFFEEFRTCDDWSYFQISKEYQIGALSADNILRCLKKAERRPIAELKLDAVMQALRNSFAHGGILPMSRKQAGQARQIQSRIIRDSKKIDRVYFISKWTGSSPEDDLGWIVMEFGLDALHKFWSDWRKLLIDSGDDELKILDRAA